MDKRLKELAAQAGLALTPNTNPVSWFGLATDLELFAELVRQDERDKCAQDYLQDCCNAIAAAEHNEREACAALVEADGRVHPKAPDAIWAKTVAKLIRARGKK